MNRFILPALLMGLIACFCAKPAMAHEVRPAYLEIVEAPNGTADILWKQPSIGESAVALRPHFGKLIDRKPDQMEMNGNFALARWRAVQVGKGGLAAHAIRIEGLERTITDVLLVVRRANGDTLQRILTPAAPTLDISDNAGAALPAYIMLGVEHILTGVDHLLFVLGLILLSPSMAMLLRTITAFTLAHSITLALTALRLLNLNPALVEALVALSILYLAVELIRKQRGENGITQRYPWIIAFGFGLLHGAAFAGALKEIGLPPDNIPGALFLFNVGVEAGQIMFVLAINALFWALRRVRLPEAAPATAWTATAYAIGSFSIFWVLERLDVTIDSIV